jgi:formylglycine-generating enzyme required for sulfatase activity
MGHVFISYSHKDTDYAHRLAENLQNMGLEAWVDERLDYGSQWPQELQKQLDNCSGFILIMSSHSYASDWVQSELQRAKRKLKPIFPLLLEGDEPWLSVESTQYYDVRGEKLPDAEFYSDIKRVLEALDGQGEQMAADGVQKSDGSKSSARPSKSRNAIYVAILAGVAVLVVAMISLIRLNLSESSTPPPGDNVTSPASTPATNETETINPGPTSPANSTEAEPAPGNSDPAKITDAKGVPMVLVPAGEFIAGSNSGYENERPAHKVYLDDFYIDQYEVTNALYKACVVEGACQPPDKTGSFTRGNYYGNYEYDNYPVLFVSWENARAYCQWRGMDLPTEAQWEKAARSDDARLYPWGDNIHPDYANYNDYVGDTVEVGSYEAGKSPYGAYDMAGNAWEWVADWYSETYYLDGPTNNPAGPESSEYKVLRGGSWHDDEMSVTTSNRGWNQLEYFENMDFAFRCASNGTP